MSDRQPRSAAAEPPVGDQGAGLAQPLGLQVTGRVQHFLHAGSAFRSFIADDNDIARFYFMAHDPCNRLLLRVKTDCRPFVLAHARCNTGCFDDRTLFGQVSEKDRETADRRECIFIRVNDTCVFDVSIFDALRQRLAGGTAEQVDGRPEQQPGPAVPDERSPACASRRLPTGGGGTGAAQRAAEKVAEKVAPS